MGILYVFNGELKADIKAALTLLQRILTAVIGGFKTMAAGITDVDAALANLEATETSLGAAIGTLSTNQAQLVVDVQALAAKVSPDLTAEVNRIATVAGNNATLLDAVNTALQQAQQADQAAGGTEGT